MRAAVASISLCGLLAIQSAAGAASLESTYEQIVAEIQLQVDAAFDAYSRSMQIFAAICATSIGFDGTDLSACGQDVFHEQQQLIEAQRKSMLSPEGLIANTLAGNPAASATISAGFTEGALVPYVLLNVDPCDAYLSNGGDGCSATPASTGSTALGARSLDEVLTDEQEALLGCGPFFGTDCEVDGIDLANAEASVLLQSFPSRGFVGTVLPGARGPGDPSYDPDVDGCVAPGDDPACADADPLVQPFVPQNDFESEMAALSWNFLMTLVAFDPDFDPTQPTSNEPGQCSFAQPQYCSSVIALLPEPAPALGALAAVGAVAFLRRHRATR